MDFGRHGRAIDAADLQESSFAQPCFPVGQLLRDSQVSLTTDHRQSCFVAFDPFLSFDFGCIGKTEITEGFVRGPFGHDHHISGLPTRFGHGIHPVNEGE